MNIKTMCVENTVRLKFCLQPWLWCDLIVGPTCNKNEKMMSNESVCMVINLCIPLLNHGTVAVMGSSTE